MRKQKFTQLYKDVVVRLENQLSDLLYLKMFSDWSGWLYADAKNYELFGFSSKKELRLKLEILQSLMNQNFVLTREKIRIIFSWDSEES